MVIVTPMTSHYPSAPIYVKVLLLVYHILNIVFYSNDNKLHQVSNSLLNTNYNRMELPIGTTVTKVPRYLIDHPSSRYNSQYIFYTISRKK